MARTSPMQLGTPAASASPMQVSIPAALPHRTPGHRLAAEDALLLGATLACSPQKEAHHNHIRMMDTLCHLDSYSLQFICELAEALRRERMPTQAPPGYHMLQASDTLQGSISSQPLSQKFYKAASNLSTAIVEPQQAPLQQCLAESHCPNPEIKSAIANMQRHEQASSMLPTDNNNNPQ